MVVVLEPVREGLAALLVRSVQLRVGPFGEERPDEALSLAIGLGPVRSGDLVAGRQGMYGFAECPRVV